MGAGKGTPRTKRGKGRGIIGAVFVYITGAA